jgi:hypothetical protein
MWFRNTAPKGKHYNTEEEVVGREALLFALEMPEV